MHLEPCINFLWRVFFFIAYRIMRVFWAVRGRRPRGAFVAIWHAGRVLVIRTSYQNYLTFPGGISRRAEPPLETALREVREEVGVTLDPGGLRHVQDDGILARLDRVGVTLYEAHLDRMPTVKIDQREIVFADFMEPGPLQAERLWPSFRYYLQNCHPQPGTTSEGALEPVQ